MAKKKQEEGEPKELRPIDIVRAALKKQLDADVLTGCERILNDKDEILSWSPSIDAVIGGVPAGCWINISGPPKTGKTTSLLTLAASAQKAGFFVVYVNVECRLKEMNLRGIKGLDLSEDKFMMLESKEGRIMSAVDYLKSSHEILKAVPKCFLMVDSVSALCGEREINEGVGTQMRGATNQVISQFCNLASSTVMINKSIIAGVTHMIANTSGYGASRVEKTSNRWVYQSDIRLRVKNYDYWTVGSDANAKQIGFKTEFITEACALPYPPGQITKTHIRFGIGIDRLYELIDFAKTVGLIKDSKSWFKLEFLRGKNKLLGIPEDEVWTEEHDKLINCNGMEKVYQKINGSPEITEELEKQMKEFYGK